MSRITAVLRRLDSFQQRHRWAAFPFAVFKKFGDDQAGNLAALIAYYGFFSLFPLLLVLVTVLGFLLHGHADLRDHIVHSTLAQFPIIGDDLKVRALQGSGLGFVIGLVGTLYGGLGIGSAAQNAMNEVWDVPIAERPGFLPRVARSLLVLVVVGAGILGTTVLSGFGTSSGSYGIALRIAALAVSTVLNVGLFALAFKVLTARKLAWGDLLAGAVVAAIAWQLLQSVGGYYVSHQLKNANAVYGFFGIVIGLLSWLYLEAQVTLLAAEVNVVRTDRLWPRSLVQPPPNEADRRVFERAVSEVEGPVVEGPVVEGPVVEGPVVGGGADSDVSVSRAREEARPPSP